MGSSLITQQAGAPADWQTHDYEPEIDALTLEEFREALDYGILNEEALRGEIADDKDINDAGDVSEDDLLVVLKEKVRQALAFVRERAGGRSLNQWVLADGGAGLETGGESWGDDPTEEYGPLRLCVEVGIFDSLRAARVVRCSKVADALIAEVGNKDVGYLLDDRVHDAKGSEAADINNGGVAAQIRYLMDECGMKPAEIREALAADDD